MRLVGQFSRISDPTIGLSDSDQHVTVAQDAVAPKNWPAEVDLILSAMEAAAPRKVNDRRSSTRSSYRTCAELKLFAEHPLEPPTPLYTRDVQDNGIGFITRQRLPLGYGGVVDLCMSDGTQLRTYCTVYRCREAINGWFEGALHFTNERRGH